MSTSIIWGLNFIAIHESLEIFPPLFLVGLRFALLAIPTVLLVPRPAVPVRWLIAYGLGFGTMQFIGLYLGMAAGLPAGLASLVLQSSAPFSVILGAILLGEKLTLTRAFGVIAAVLGLALVGVSRASGQAWVPYLLVILGGLGWALGNLASRRANAANPLHFALWMSVVPPLPLFVISLVTEGPDRIREALGASLSSNAIPAWLGLGYTVLLGTVVAAGIWAWLMKRHPVGTVAPFSMLVPITGLLAGWAILHETPTMVELIGGALVIGGVVWASRGSSRAAKTPSTPAASKIN